MDDRIDAAAALARDALADFPVSDDATLTFVKYRENVVFRVIDGAEEYALRIARPGYRTDAQIASEVTFVRALREREIDVPDFVRTRDDRDFTVRELDGRRHQVLLQRWVEGGAPLDDIANGFDGTSELTPDDFAQVGALAASMHDTCRGIGRPPGYDRPAWDREGLVGAAPLWGDPRAIAELDPADVALIDEVCASLSTMMDAAGRGADVFGVLHADFSPENVLRAPDGSLTLIDFDDFGEGWHAFDLATSLFFFQPHPRYAEYRRALEDGYANTAAAPERTLALLDAMILARGLTYLGWAAQRRGDETAEFLVADVRPLVLDLARAHLAAHDTGSRSMTDELLDRRRRTIGPHSPLFYSTPLHAVSASGVWITAADGARYLDAYNNVPHVGHGNPRVIAAATAQWGALNVHTRYLNERVVDYAERLLETFGDGLDRIFFTNSGSEANELALRIARQRTGNTGVLVSDFSYHGNTTSLAELTTGLRVAEPLGAHVRAVRIPDVRGADEAAVLEAALAEVDEAIASLRASGHGVSALLFDPSFSTEGLNDLPAGYLAGVAERVRAAGGLVIADEVQSGFGRLGDALWGHDVVGVRPDLVTLGKPIGNGHPIGAVVTGHAVLEEFGERNLYFNTFAGNPVSSSVGLAVLDEIQERGLVAHAARLGAVARARLEAFAADQPRIRAVKGRGLFFGLELVDDGGWPDAVLARRVVEEMYRRNVLISRVGRDDNVLKIRPPLVIEPDELDQVLATLEASVRTAVGSEE